MSVGLYYELMRLHHNDFGEIGEIGEKSEQRFTSMLINVLISDYALLASYTGGLLVLSCCNETPPPRYTMNKQTQQPTNRTK